jgi:hypothetical protein
MQVFREEMAGVLANWKARVLLHAMQVCGWVGGWVGGFGCGCVCAAGSRTCKQQVARALMQRTCKLQLMRRACVLRSIKALSRHYYTIKLY